MKKNALTIITAILLILYALTNFGAAFGQFAKGKAISGTASIAAGLGDFSGNKNTANDIRWRGSTLTLLTYALAVFILLTAVLDITAAVGMFGGQTWAFSMVLTASICGLLLEIQDTVEDGFGVFKLLFFGVNLLALGVALSAKETEPTMEEAQA